MSGSYLLDEQIGFALRLAGQRHTAIFQEIIEDELTPTQFSTLIRLSEVGASSQNHLGRLVGMDVATTKGVVDRLRKKNLISSVVDETDVRRRKIQLTDEGAVLVNRLKRRGKEITRQTLEPLDNSERATLLALLKKIS
ncbi:MAG: MarR family transcriptional regulator [Pseudomonadota bacterium]